MLGICGPGLYNGAGLIGAGRPGRVGKVRCKSATKSRTPAAIFRATRKDASILAQFVIIAIYNEWSVTA